MSEMAEGGKVPIYLGASWRTGCDREMVTFRWERRVPGQGGPSALACDDGNPFREAAAGSGAGSGSGGGDDDDIDEEEAEEEDGDVDADETPDEDGAERVAGPKESETKGGKGGSAGHGRNRRGNQAVLPATKSRKRAAGDAASTSACSGAAKVSQPAVEREPFDRAARPPAPLVLTDCSLLPLD